MKRLAPRAVVCLALVIVAGAISADGQELQIAPPPGRDLMAIALPRLDDLEPAVSDHLRQQRQSFALVSSNAGSSDRALSDAYGEIGRVFHAYELFDAAEAAYANALRLIPRSVTWLHLLGDLYQQTGRFELARERYVAARGAAPNDRELAVHLAEVDLRLNRLEDARRGFERLVSVFPAVARNGLGEIALRERRYAEAVAHFEAALDRAPQARAIHYSLAMAYRGLGRLDDARAHLQKRGPEEIHPADQLLDDLPRLVRGERAHLMLGRRAFEAGRFSESAAAFGKALDTSPESIAGHLGLGLSLAQLGDTVRAATHLQKALQGDGELDEDVVLQVTVSLADRQRFSEAITLVDAAHRRFPARARTGTTLARLWAAVPDRSLRDGERAFALAMRIHEDQPSPAHAETVALALAELGRCSEAAAWLRRAIDQADRSGDRAESTRLKVEAPRYAGASCRP